ncbi:MAG TPA: winged helix-turn-helix domain-containing protein [Thermoanaerobaculia bacterium]|nr:winged helix-turn-helix domain-containing protein [Thermoanaerobaculia bacterium]
MSGSRDAAAFEAPADFRIADRLVQPATNRVSFDGRTITLEPKIMQVLVRLAGSPRDVVTKEELLASVWNGTYVTEDVLTRAVGELRKLFGDDAAQPRVIETIRKRGYRLLIAPSDPARTPDSRPATAEAAAVPAGRRWTAAAAALFGAIAVVIVAIVLVQHRPPKTAQPIRIIPITTYPGNEVSPAVSPDGTRVAFTWEKRGEKPGIWVKVVDSEPPLRVTTATGADRYPAWSPDGREIAFARIADGHCTLSAVSAVGGPVRTLGDCGDNDGVKPSWSPDGRSIAVPGRLPDRRWRIELLDLAGGARKPLTDPPEGEDGDWNPVFSPDGNSIAFVRTLTDGVDDLWVVPARGGDARRLTFENRALTGADWTPDGKNLVFSSSRAGLFSLWRLPLSGGEPQLVGGGGSKMKHPSAARARNAVAYENWNYEVNLWSLPLAAGQPLRVTFAADEWEFDPEFSPDGTRIAYVSTRSGAPEIFTASSRGGDPVQVTKLGGPQVSAPRWSPDGKTIVFSARPQGQADLYAVPAGGGTPRRLTADPGDELAASFSRDGEFVYYASRRSGTWQIWKIPSAGGPATMVTRGGGVTAFESADGGTLYFTRPDAPGLWRMPAAGGNEELVSADLRPASANDWRVTARGAYFREDRGDAAPVVRFLAFGGTNVFAARDEPTAPVVATLDAQAWSGISVAPDDSALVYGRADRRDADIRMIENAF